MEVSERLHDHPSQVAFLVSWWMGDIIFRKVLKKMLLKERSPIHQLTKKLLDFGYPIVSYSPSLPEVTSCVKGKKIYNLKFKSENSWILLLHNIFFYFCYFTQKFVLLVKISNLDESLWKHLQNFSLGLTILPV